MTAAVDSSDTNATQGRPVRIVTLLLVFAVGWLPALLGRSAIGEAASLHTFILSSTGYFVSQHAFFLYVWTPMVVLSSCLMFLTPGMILSIAANAAKNANLWVISGLGISLVLISAAVATIQAITGFPIKGNAFVIVVLACSLVSAGILVRRLRSQTALAWPLEGEGATSILLMIAIVLMVLIGLFPKLFWENLNGDGVHAFESGRLLLYNVLPFWGDAAGPIANYPGVTTMLASFVVSWFIRLFGEVEAAARLPFVLFSGTLFCSISALIAHGRTASTSAVNRYFVAAGVLLFAAVCAFNATYNPYMADIALPAVREALLMTCVLAFFLYFVRREYFWMVLFLALAYLLLPTVQMLAALWLFATFVVFRAAALRQIFVAGIALAACILSTAILPSILRFFDLPIPGQEFSAEGVLQRFDLQIPDFRRLLFLIVPSGIVPVFALLLWKQQDAIGKCLTIVTAAYFTFFFLQSHTAFHHFIPAILFPVVIFWRMQWDRMKYGWIMPGVTAVGLLVSFFLSLPSNFVPDSSGRIVGHAIEDRTGGYEQHDPRAFGRADILQQLFPAVWDVRVPNRSYGGSWLVWYFYAHHNAQSSEPKNYVLQFSADDPPAGSRLIARNAEVALYVRDMQLWKWHRAMQPKPTISAIYKLPRGTMFIGQRGKK